MRRQFPIFTLFSVALYILIMSIHIAAKQGEIADKILLPGDPLRAKFIAENFLEDAVCLTKSVICLVTQVPTKGTVFLLWEQGWECHQSLSMPVS